MSNLDEYLKQLEKKAGITSSTNATRCDSIAEERARFIKELSKIKHLHVFPSQQSFVASNRQSIIDAYICGISGGHVQPFGIFDGETPVGFLMIGFDIADAIGIGKYINDNHKKKVEIFNWE